MAGENLSVFEGYKMDFGSRSVLGQYRMDIVRCVNQSEK